MSGSGLTARHGPVPPLSATGATMSGRNVGLTREAGRLRALGMDAAEIERALLAPPAHNGTPASECRSIARSNGTKPFRNLNRAARRRMAVRLARVGQSARVGR